MALATQCPHCQTTFRVAHDQLKLRAGLVRCGHCKEIFNGIEHLLPPPPADATDATDAMSSFPAHKDVAVSVAPTPAIPFEEMPTEISLPEPGDNEALALPAHATTLSDNVPDVASYAQTEAYRPADLMQRMTLLDFKRELPENPGKEADVLTTRELSNAEEDEAFDPQTHDELDAAIEDLQRKPWRNPKKKVRLKATTAAPATEDEPGFVKRGRRQQRLGRKLRVVFSLGSFILLIIALLQSTYLFRNQIAGLYPQAKPALTQMCDLLGCRINLPAQIATVSIESSELQALENKPDMFVLTTLLRNYSKTAQEWPYIELTLNDRSEKTLLRRVFKPADYLDNAADIRQGFAADTERSARLSFVLSQIKASGYRVYLFYP